ncbi:NosD domain-containing protein [Methanococcus maripaludis]|uniref:Parallel beta-helix repeat protein n=1 Tax=Methanococcus maripaludis TaxID=39152 RepID=A0A8T4H3H5_METMI|nr:NosD domain-containing protein [Methanococcus maripaludis]MBM7408810.1 hypothetical protein [Methanococcus maripaludis]MBP2219003.1 hypothetical protein [Methanococcus maripaludis]
MIKKCLLFLLLLFALGSVNAVDINYSNPTDVNINGTDYHVFALINESGEYTVTANFANNTLSDNDIVLVIKDTENVVLDCNNMFFSTNTTNSPYIIYAYNSSNVTVKNLNANWSYDTIFVKYVNDFTLENSEIISEGYSIELQESYGTKILENTFNTMTYDGSIVFDDTIENSTISGNTINMVSTVAVANGICGDHGIINSTIEDNIISINSTVGTAYGIRAYWDNIVNSTIKNNVIDLYSADNAYGIYSKYSTNNEITGNTINITLTNSDAYGICAYYNITNNIISGNNITANATDEAYGICSYDEDITNVTIEDNVFDLSSDYETYCIYACDYLYNVSISENNVTENGYDGSYFIYTDNNDLIGSTIKNNEITIISNDGDAYCIYPYAIIGSVISGNTITAYGEDCACGIYACGEDLVNSTIESNLFNISSNTSDSECIYTDCNILNTIISGNTFISESNGDYSYGIYAYNNFGNSTILGNNITVDAYNDSYGIYACQWGMANSTILGNNITLNSSDDCAYGIFACESMENSTISGNNITADSYGYSVGFWTKKQLVNSTINDNIIDVNTSNEDSYGIRTSYGIENTVISGNNISSVATIKHAYGISSVNNNVINSTVEYNTIYTVGRLLSTGIYNNMCIENATINGNNVTVKSDYEAQAIEAWINITDSVISGNNITADSINSASCGICAHEEDIINSTILGNTMALNSTGNYAYGIFAENNLTNSVIFENVITADSFFDAYGICVNNGDIVNTTFLGNKITLNSTKYSLGIYGSYGINLTILGNNITADAYEDAYGIYPYRSITNSTISENILRINGSNHACGIFTDRNIVSTMVSGNNITTTSEYGNTFDIGKFVFNSTLCNNTAHYICIYGDNNTISSNTLVGEYYTSMYIYGNNNEIFNNTILNNTSDENEDYFDYSGSKMYVEGDYNTISSNVLHDAWVYSRIEVYGNNTAISSNTVEYFIHLEGNNATISSNVLHNDNYGDAYIEVYGNNATISSNTVDNTIWTGGQYNTISSNTIIDTENYAIDFNGDLDNEIGAYATVFNNTIRASKVGICLNNCFEDYSNITQNTVYADEYPIIIGDNVTGCNIYLNNFIYTGNSSNISGIMPNTTVNNSLVSPFEIEYKYNGNIYSNTLGNYWSDYNGTDSDGNGIGDIYYLFGSDYEEYGYLENDTAPLMGIWNNGEIKYYVAPTTTAPSSSHSSSGGRSYDSDISDEISSKVIKNFVSSAAVIYGNEIDQQFAEELRERIQNANGYKISGNAVIVGGPNANGFAREYNDQFEMPISNDYPGENKGIIQILKVQDNSGKIVQSYTIVYIAGSDRLGTQAALEYFKTLDELPEGPIMVEWTANGPVVVE